MIEFSDFFFQSDTQGHEFEKKLSFDEFMELVLKLRGQNPATVTDVVELQHFVKLEASKQNNTMARLEERLDILQESLFDDDCSVLPSIMHQAPVHHAFATA